MSVGRVPSYERWARAAQAARESTRQRRGLALSGPSELLGSPYSPANRQWSDDELAAADGAFQDV